MKTQYCLHTDILFDIFVNEPNVIAKLKELKSYHYITTQFHIIDIKQIVYEADVDKTKQSRIEEALETLHVLPFRNSALDHYVTITHSLSPEQRKQLRERDLLIASTCKDFGITLVTNMSVFEDIIGVEVFYPLKSSD